MVKIKGNGKEFKNHLRKSCAVAVKEQSVAPVRSLL